MAIGAGDLRTVIRVVDRTHTTNDSGIPISQEKEVCRVHCKWVNAHGNEVYLAKQTGVMEPATLTMRYVKGVTPTCEIYRGADPEPYEVISINDILDRHTWLELKVQRKAVSQ